MDEREGTSPPSVVVSASEEDEPVEGEGRLRKGSGSAGAWRSRPRGWRRARGSRLDAALGKEELSQLRLGHELLRNRERKTSLEVSGAVLLSCGQCEPVKERTVFGYIRRKSRSK